MKKVFLLCLILVFYIFYDAASVGASSQIFKNITAPFNRNKDPYYGISIYDLGDPLVIRNTVESIATETQTNLMITNQSLNSENEFTTYWYLVDESYLENIQGLNKSITISEFNKLNESITNKQEPSSNHTYFLNYPNSKYKLNLAPFSMYESSNIASEIKIFAKNDASLQSFFTKLSLAEIDFHLIDAPPNQEMNPSSLLINLLLSNSVMMFIFPLMLVSLFMFLFFERSNMRIMRMNGYSRVQITFHLLKKVLFDILKLALSVFILLWLVHSNLSLSYIHFFLKNYVTLVFVTIVIISLFIMINISLLKSLSLKSFSSGWHQGDHSGVMLNILKLVLLVVLVPTMIASMNAMHSLSKSYSFINNTKAKHENMFVLNSNSPYMRTLLINSSEIYEKIKSNSSVLFVSHFRPDQDHEDDMVNKIVFVNDNYLRKMNLKLLDNSKINTEQTNVVYTKKLNEVAVNALKEKTSILCETGLTCVDTEVKVVSNDAFISLLGLDIDSNASEIEEDFILVPLSSDPGILNIMFNFSNENEIDALIKSLDTTLDTSELEFTSVEDYLIKNLNQLRQQISKTSIDIVSQIIVVGLISLISYTVIFERKKKEMSILWINGVNPNPKMYTDLVLEMFLSLLASFIAYRMILIEPTPTVLILPLIVFFTIDIFVFLINKKMIRTRIILNVKERNGHDHN